jgi:uncharacterized membrane protein YtjA (UPF0391 family)
MIRTSLGETISKEQIVLKWALIFFVVSLVAGYFGFTGVASGARSISKVLFFIAIALFLIILIFGVFLGMLAF